MLLPRPQAPVPNIIFEDVQLADEPRTAAQWWDVLYPTLLAVREQDAACRQLVNGGAQAVVRELADNSDLDNFRGTKHVFLPRYTRLSTDDLNGVLSINPRKDLRQILDVVSTHFKVVPPPCLPGLQWAQNGLISLV